MVLMGSDMVLVLGRRVNVEPKPKSYKDRDMMRDV